MSDDLKRIENATATFEKIAITVGVLFLLLALWVRAPHFQMNPAAGAGFSGILGFNVGHAVVFGPILVLLAFGTYAGLLGRREMLRRAFCRDLEAGHFGEEKLSGGARLVLDKFQQHGPYWRLAPIADRYTRTLWFFILPVATSAICILRYFDLIPDEDVIPFTVSKAWSLPARLMVHLFSARIWAVRSVLPDHFLDTNADLRAQMPYIYSPLQPWLYLAFFACSVGLAVRTWQLYFQATPLPAAVVTETCGNASTPVAAPVVTQTVA